MSEVTEAVATEAPGVSVVTEAVAAALHELRRPLQVAMLALTGPARPASAIASLEQVAAALELLEHELGLRAAPAFGRGARVAAADLLADARLRWSGLDAGGAPAAVDVDFAEPGLELRGDRRRLGAALDNLIANALEHGGGGARVGLRAGPGGAMLTVDNPIAAAGRGRGGPRRGHGLAVVARTAAELGGRLGVPRRRGSRIVSELTVPLAGDERRRPVGR